MTYRIWYDGSDQPDFGKWLYNKSHVYDHLNEVVSRWNSWRTCGTTIVSKLRVTREDTDQTLIESSEPIQILTIEELENALQPKISVIRTPLEI